MPLPVQQTPSKVWLRRATRGTDVRQGALTRDGAWAIAALMLLVSSILVAPSARGAATGIRFRSSVTGTGSTLTLRRPPGTEAGDVLVAAIAKHEQVGTAIRPPAGWSLLTNTIGSDDRTEQDLQLVVYTRVARSSEPSTYTWQTADPDANGAILCYEGVSSSNPVLAFASRSEKDRITEIRIPPLSVSLPKSMLVLIATIEGPTPNPITPPRGFTERVERAVHPTIEASEMMFPSTGSTGSRVARAPHDGNSIATLLALRPSAAPVSHRGEEEDPEE